MPDDPRQSSSEAKAMIRTFDDPILSRVCEPVEPGDDLSFTEDMRRTCEVLNGVGLAAPQIGIAKRVVFIWPRQKNGEALFLINPGIVKCSVVSEVAEEGCLSYPGFTAEVKRTIAVTVRYLDLINLKSQTRDFVYFTARVVQHEMDHLDGICKVRDAWKSLPLLRA